MGIFDLGSGEIIIILVVALLLFGPEKIIDIARSLGKAVNSLKKTANEFTSEVTKELDAANKAAAEATTSINKEIAGANKAVSEITAQVNSGLNAVRAPTNNEIRNMSNQASASNTQQLPQSKLSQPVPLVESNISLNPPAKL